MFYSKVSFSFSYGVYCIDNMVEHARLLSNISRGLCKLDRSAVPERFAEHFKPYIIDSMEFEFVNLTPSATKLEIRKEEERKAKNIKLRLIENVMLAPVKNVFIEKIEKLMLKVKALKLSVDFMYFLFFSGGFKTLHENSSGSKEVLTRILLTMTCLLR